MKIVIQHITTSSDVPVFLGTSLYDAQIALEWSAWQGECLVSIKCEHDVLLTIPVTRDELRRSEPEVMDIIKDRMFEQLYQNLVYRVKGFAILPYVLLKELPSCYILLVANEPKKYIKRQTLGSEWCATLAEAEKVLHLKAKTRFNRAKESLANTIREIRIMDVPTIFRVRYAINDEFECEHWELMDKTKKAWIVNNPDATGKARQKYLYPLVYESESNSTLPHGKWIFSSEDKDDVMGKISLFAHNRMTFLRTVMSRTS